MIKKNNLKGISICQSKHIKFEDFKKCLDGKKYQKNCIKNILCSINHEIHIQELKNQHYIN